MYNLSYVDFMSMKRFQCNENDVLIFFVLLYDHVSQHILLIINIEHPKLSSYHAALALSQDYCTWIIPKTHFGFQNKSCLPSEKPN